jgi:hypothetical protein
MSTPPLGEKTDFFGTVFAYANGVPFSFGMGFATEIFFHATPLQWSISVI